MCQFSSLNLLVNIKTGLSLSSMCIYECIHVHTHTPHLTPLLASLFWIFSYMDSVFSLFIDWYLDFDNKFCFWVSFLDAFFKFWDRSSLLYPSLMKISKSSLSYLISKPQQKASWNLAIFMFSCLQFRLGSTQEAMDSGSLEERPAICHELNPELLYQNLLSL